MKQIIKGLLLLSLLIALTALAQKPAPKIGLALGGGGARGGVHIGIIRELEKLNIPIDCVAGTSVGAVVGGLYASGYSADEIEKKLTEVNWDHVLTESIPRNDRSFQQKLGDDFYLIESKPGIRKDGLHLPPGINLGQQTLLLLKRFYARYPTLTSFDNLPIPFRAMATDLATGQAYAFDHGDIATAVLASMSIPGVFAPVKYQDHLLVDGGVSSNLPIKAVRDMCADIVIAVNISAPLHSSNEIDSILTVTDQLTNILINNNTRAEINTLTNKDILIHPQNIEVSTMEFTRIKDTIKLGEQAAQEIRDKLTILAGPKVEPASPENNDLIISEIEILNNSRLSDHYLKSLISVKEGDHVTTTDLENSVNRFIGLGFFSTVRYFIHNDVSGNRLTYEFTEKSWGPTFLRFGSNYRNSNRTNSSFAIAAGFQHVPLTDRGGEFLAGVQLGNSPGIALRLSLPSAQNPKISLLTDGIMIWEERRNNAPVRIIESTLRAAYTPDNNYRISTGFQFSDFSDHDIYNPSRDPAHFALISTFIYDDLDNLDFPKSGDFVSIDIAGSSSFLDSDYHYQVLSANWRHALTRGRFTIETAMGFQLGNIQNLPPQRYSKLGGFKNLSGYTPNSLIGGSSWLTSLTFQRDFNTITPIGFKIPMSFGFSLEAGNVAENTSELKFLNPKLSGSIFFGLRTGVGPLFIGIGASEDDSIGYLLLGHTF
ncbi:MAG: patatin-like phospholipase family protein [bacterium]